MTDPLQGIGRSQRRRLDAILSRLAGLWTDLTKAAAAQDRSRVEAIQREISECRREVEEIKRAGTVGSA